MGFNGRFKLTAAVLVLVGLLLGLASASWGIASYDISYGMKVGRNGIRVGNNVAYDKFTVGGTTGNVTSAGTLSITGATTLTGLLNANGGLAVDTTHLTVNGTNWGISWIPSATTGTAGTLDFSTLTSGIGLKLIGVDATLNGGSYVGIYGGDGTSLVWSVGEGGDTDIAGDLTADTAAIGGGYGDTGVSISSAGVIQADGAAVFAGGIANTKYATINTDATGAVAVTNADTGELFVATKSDGATTYTLDDPSANTVGCVFYFMQTADQAMNVVPTTADGNSIVANGVATSDKVSIETADHKVGGGICVVGISATKWFAYAMGGATMTVEAAD